MAWLRTHLNVDSLASSETDFRRVEGDVLQRNRGQWRVSDGGTRGEMGQQVKVASTHGGCGRGGGRPDAGYVGGDDQEQGETESLATLTGEGHSASGMALQPADPLASSETSYSRVEGDLLDGSTLEGLARVQWHVTFSRPYQAAACTTEQHKQAWVVTVTRG